MTGGRRLLLVAALVLAAARGAAADRAPSAEARPGATAPARPEATAPARPEARRPPLATVGPAGLRVTLGELRPGAGGRFRIEAPKTRAVAPAFRSGRAELAFTYLGPTADVAPLASGERRRQLGLKLRAADGCNLVYVMWRLEPVPGLVVSVKSNPGKRTHAACGADGYRNVRPRRSAPVPALAPGDRHVLAAALDGTALRVEVDGRPVWEGDVGVESRAFAGPIGLRTDNVRCEVELRGASE